MINALERGFQQLQDQQGSFAAVTYHATWQIVCGYEEHGSPEVRNIDRILPSYLTFLPKVMVPKDSAVIYGSNTVEIAIPADHRNMCKFAHKNNVGYRRLLHQIRRSIAA